MSLLAEATDYNQYNNPDMDWISEGAADSPQRKFMVRAINLMPEEVQGKSVLDVGCGSGWFLREAIGKGAVESVGLEPSKFAGIARTMVPKATIAQTTFEEYEPDSNRFDLVSFIMSTEHMANLQELLTKAKGLLKPDSCLLIMTGDLEAFQGERFGYKITTEMLKPGKEVVVRTQRPTDFGTTTDIVRSRDYWKEIAVSVGLSVIQDLPVMADSLFVADIPKFKLFEKQPFMQIFRFNQGNS
ncbi:MAG TPA: class I SAM-dependent methyltransferase [Candidatus Saccharimonadales bacterium]